MVMPRKGDWVPKHIGCVGHDCPECKRMADAETARVNGQPPMLYVEWVDSCSTHGWCQQHDIDAAGVPMLCRSVGIFVKETDTAIVLALNAGYGEHCARPYGDMVTIPKAAITLRANITAHYSK